MLKDADILKYQTADEQKHLAKEAKDRKVIQGKLIVCIEPDGMCEVVLTFQLLLWYTVRT